MDQKTKSIILGIESSCDETAAAIVKISGGKFQILSNIVSSQIEIHKKFGGVVPEIAARNHVKNILPVIEKSLAKAKIKPAQIAKIAVTAGPGLITSLLVGVQTAKTLGRVWQKPVCPINHLKAHLYANWISNQSLKFPALCLLVSGGHTEIILLKNQTQFKKVGQTLDDAAGEAFDKVAQLLKLGYPGGPIISRLAAKGNPKAFAFARPMINSNDFNFSFSGLKTSVLYLVKKLPTPDQKTINDLSASFQQSAVDVLAAKTFKAAKFYQAKTLMLSGGVAANLLLRQTFAKKSLALGIDFSMPDINLCTDNAVMAAVAGYFTQPIALAKIKVNPNLEI